MFRERHPRIDIETVVERRFVDVVAEGFGIHLIEACGSAGAAFLGDVALRRGGSVTAPRGPLWQRQLVEVATSSCGSMGATLSPEPGPRGVRSTASMGARDVTSEDREA